MSNQPTSDTRCQQDPRYTPKKVVLPAEVVGDLEDTRRLSYIPCDAGGAGRPELRRSVLSLPVDAHVGTSDYGYAELLYVVEGKIEIEIVSMTIAGSARRGSGTVVRYTTSEPLVAIETFSLEAGEAAFLDHVKAKFKVVEGPALIVSTGVVPHLGPGHTAWRPGP